MVALIQRLSRLSAAGLASTGRAPAPPAVRPADTGAPRRAAPAATTDLCFHPDGRTGASPLVHVPGAAPEVLAGLALDAALAGVYASRLLYLDTETTGLHGGAGTLPFLIGLAWWEAGHLRVRQLFLEAPGREAPLLREVGERLAWASALVTYNGKCFDWPLLRTRFVLNRVPLPPARPHLDVLHCARRAFKHRFDGVKLKTLEAGVLGHHRVGDIDGALIPQVYFDFLDSGDGAQVQRVLDHNADDLVSLAALLGELCRRFDAVAPEDDAEDVLALAQVAARAGQLQRAQRLAQAAATFGSAQAWCFLASLAARAGDAPRAVQWLQAAASVEASLPAVAAPVHLLLAKLYEHRLRDLSLAHHHAALAAPAESRAASEKRLARLARRLGRTAPAPGTGCGTEKRAPC